MTRQQIGLAVADAGSPPCYTSNMIVEVHGLLGNTTTCVMGVPVHSCAAWGARRATEQLGGSLMYGMRRVIPWFLRAVVLQIHFPLAA